MDTLLGMGFTPAQCTKALAESGDNAEFAANYIMMNLDQPESFWVAAPEPPEPEGAPDDAGEYADVLKPFLDKVKVASRTDKVFKEECVYSCARPTSAAGLFVGLETFVGVGEAMLAHHCARTGESVFVNITRRRKAPEEQGEEAAKNIQDAIARKAKEETVDYDETLTLMILTNAANCAERVVVPLDGQPLLPGKVQRSLDSILNANDAGLVADLGDWKPDIRESKYAAGLQQVDTHGVVKSCNPADWKCDITGQTTGSGEGQTESLWLNLSDGFIGGGRRNWDGSGGNNTALDHYAEMKTQGKEYPLAVKLGTITADGDGAIGDVFSYAADEDDMVLDPNLKQHLAHWGIDAAALSKTEKTMAEMELELNQKYEWGRILEDGKELEPVFGPGLTGLINMGNTCYMNSIMQLLLSVKPFEDAYGSSDELVLSSASPTTDLRCQLTKVVRAMMSGNHSAPLPEVGEPDEVGVRPKLLKMLMGEGHDEFSSSRQQDAIEYLYHVFQKLERAEKAAGSGHHLDGAVEYLVQDRLECMASHKVKYNTNKQDRRKVFSLEIPMHLAKNQVEFEAYTARCEAHKQAGTKNEETPVVRQVDFEDMLKFNQEPEVLQDWGESGLQKSTSFATFPPYLLVHVKREVFDPSTQSAIKLDVNVPLPSEIDLTGYRGTGIQAGEVEMEDSQAAAPPPPCDEDVVNQLAVMGFPEAACRKAVIKTSNAGVEPAMEWLMAHMEDPDFAEPIKPPSASGDATVDEEAVNMLMAMGFERPKCVKALRETNGDQERAVEWMFSHPDDTGCDEAPASVEPQDGDGKYELLGFVSHVGKNTNCGHYVAHIKKDGRWVFFNDEKVVLSQEPPVDCGYLYLYRRV
jgi:ubiquitin carboxyl-terminal hydrolase 5/13